MPESARKFATYDDLVGLAPNLVGEIVHGVLHAQPRPAPAHARAGSSLGVSLGGPFDHGHGGPGGWWILDEPECHLGAHVLVPDLAGWRRERMPKLPEIAWFDLALDWVCEILSPRTAQLDRVQKMPIYAKAGVQHMWLVDPALRTLEAYRREGDSWLLLASFADQAVARIEPFDAIELELGLFWA